MVGDAPAYVKNLWAEAKDHVLSEANFRQALEEFVVQWNPSVTEAAARLDIILSLIQAFRPPSGFVKIAGHLKTSNWFRKMYSPPISRSDSKPFDLHLKALKVLESYFKTAPLQITTAYQTYVHILQTHTKYESYSSYALARLLDLEEKEWSEPEVLDYIEQRPGSLVEIIPVILRGHLLSVAGAALGGFFAISIKVQATDLFEEVVRREGWTIHPELRQIFANGRRRILEMPNPLLIKNEIRIPLNLPASGIIDFVENESILKPEWLERPELYEDKIREVVQDVIARSLLRLEGTQYSWKELTEDVNELGVELRVDEKQVLVRIPNSPFQVPLQLGESLNAILEVYTDTNLPEIEENLKKASRVGA